MGVYGANILKPKNKMKIQEKIDKYKKFGFTSISDSLHQLSEVAAIEVINKNLIYDFEDVVEFLKKEYSIEPQFIFSDVEIPDNYDKGVSDYILDKLYASVKYKTDYLIYWSSDIRLIHIDFGVAEMTWSGCWEENKFKKIEMKTIKSILTNKK